MLMIGVPSATLGSIVTVYVIVVVEPGGVKTEFADVGNDCEVRILGELRPARIIDESPYDPKNEALRA